MGSPSDNAPSGLFSGLAEDERRYTEVEQLIQDPAVLSNQARMAPLLREYGALKRKVEPYRAWLAATKARDESLEEAAGADDAEVRAMFEEEATAQGATAEQLEQELIDLLLTADESGERDVIVEMRAGTGGDEACLWVADLFDMYTHWCESKRWKIAIMDESPNEVGGYKELNFTVKGERVYDAMRWESGGHRVQRVPATESQGRVHTSMATVAALPQAEEVDIQINPADLEIEAMRSGGPGGQSVNKTSSAIRIVHKPSGEMVHCQVHKSQHKNRDMAMSLLRARLYEQQQAARDAERNALRKSQVGSGDRSARIRTYNYAQNRVTDHRIEGDGEDGEPLPRNFSLDRVLQGDLDPLHASLRQWHKRKRLEELGAA